MNNKMTDSKLQLEINRYRKKHPRTTAMRLNGDNSPLETFKADQPGLNIIEELLARNADLKKKNQNLINVIEKLNKLNGYVKYDLRKDLFYC